MSWLRIDDGFSRNPKVTSLTHKQRWIWVDILCYCSRYDTDGYVPENLHEFIAGATESFLEKLIDRDLLDDTSHGLRVHDWLNYAPKDKTSAERQAKWRAKQRNGAVTESVTANVTAETVTESSTSHAGAAGVPVPSPKEHSSSVQSLARPDDSDGQTTEAPDQGNEQEPFVPLLDAAREITHSTPTGLGLTDAERAHIAAVDEWWKDPAPVVKRDPFDEPMDLGRLADG